VQPTVGYQLHPRLKVGFGAAYVLSDIELKQRVDLSEQVVPSPSLPPGTTFGALGIPTGSDFAEGQLQAEGNGLAFNIGAIVKVSERFSIGARYLSRTTIEYDGDAVFTQIPTGLTLAPNNALTGTTTPVDALVAPNFVAGGPLGDGGVGTEIVMPPQAAIGFAWQASEKTALMADFHTVIWGWFASLPVDFDNPGTPDFTLYEGYNDTYGIRVGLEHQYRSNLMLRGGYLYHTAAAPAQTVTPLLPEGARNEFTLGVGWTVHPKMKVDFGYQYIRQNDRRGRVHDETIGNTGLYTFKGNLFGLGLSYTF
jgi:long-chain fatty acid transport protein